MCGIATISIGRGARDRIPYDKLRRLTTELMVELQPRGLDASGIAVINAPETEESWVFKKAIKPDRLVVRPRFQETLEKIGPHTNFVMLHARATTVGSTEDNFNNHPIIIPGYIGIHNGTLWNEDKLFTQHEKDFPRAGEVDSEIIFRLYGYYCSQGLSPEEAMKKTASELSGAFTGAVVGWDNPNVMVMFKNERALCLIRIPYYDMVIAVSESKFFHRAAQRLKIKTRAAHHYVYDGVGLLMDLSKSGAFVNNVVDFSLPVEKNRFENSKSRWLSTSYYGGQ
jgi:glucosamine 6-phosphate synthetase-like amidotransferase/phosphosugar isomerase protein